jgi:predicted Fe-Mo cluster-binding NifX family protein
MTMMKKGLPDREKTVPAKGNTPTLEKNVGNKNMKVAFVSDDKETISGHFGRAKGFMVYEVDGNKVKSQEYRLNRGGNKGKCGTCHHDLILETIKDCQTVVAMGMGQGIYEDLKNNGIQAIITDETEINTALDKVTQGTIISHLERLH